MMQRQIAFLAIAGRRQENADCLLKRTDSFSGTGEVAPDKERKLMAPEAGL